MRHSLHFTEIDVELTPVTAVAISFVGLSLIPELTLRGFFFRRGIAQRKYL